MAKQKNVPELRFKGFTGEWEDKAFLAVFKCSIPSNTLSRAELNYDIGTIKNIHYGDVLINLNAITNVSEERLPYITDGQQSKYKDCFLKNGDVVFADTAEDETVGKATEIAGIEKSLVVSGLHTIVGRPQIAMQQFFLGYYINSTTFHQQLLALMQGIKVLSISRSGLAATYVQYPNSPSEQIKIGSFFHNLDALIAGHERKHDKLLAVKKAMLENMFPKEGAELPELRFKSFGGKWQKKELGEIYRERNDRGNDSLPILSVSIHTGVSDGELDNETLGKQVRRSEDKSKYKHVLPGDLIFNMMRAWQGAIGVAVVEGMVSPAYITAIPNEQVYPHFMDICLSRDQIVAQMDNLSYGVTDFRKRLYWDSFVRVQCIIPSVPEQEKLTAYFQCLDSLISLHSRELDKLKNIKKACLEKMFV